MFFLNAGLFGIGLAMDAFSVSMANGLAEPDMKKRKSLGIAGVFGIFQTAMPLIGWLCIHTLFEAFESFQRFIPWIALALLGFLGGRMLIEGIRGTDAPQAAALGIGALLVQGIATSIDALSVGFTIAELDLAEALIEALIIGVVTFGICIAGVYIGRKLGAQISGKATVVGGVILILIGIEIFLKGVL